jgi:cobalt-zinc-cadmium efflux system outer membrane protein
MKLPTLLFCSSILIAIAKADHGGETLALEDVTRIVLGRNPAIQASRKKWNAMTARVPQAAAWDDLRISAEQRLARFVNVPRNAFTDERVGLEQMIPLTGKNRIRGRIAQAEARTAFEQAHREQLDVVVKARSAFYRLANASDQLALNEKNVTSLQQIAEIATDRYSVGNDTAGEALAAQTEASKMRETQRDLERALADERTQLNVLMNRDAFAPIGQLAGGATIPAAAFSVDRLRAQLLAHRPEIKIAQAKIDAEKAKLDLARREWIPDPTLSLRADRYNDARESVSEVTAGILMSVPWLNYRKYSAGAREAAEELSAAGSELERAEKESIGLLREQLQKIATARHHVELFRDQILPQSQQAFEASQLGYENGKTRFSEWIGAQHSLREIEAMARQHLADYQIAVAELDGIVGAEFSEEAK